MLIYDVLPPTTKLPVIFKSPVIVPPLFASILLLARINAAVIELFCVASVAVAALAAKKAASAVDWAAPAAVNAESAVP